MTLSGHRSHSDAVSLAGGPASAVVRQRWAGGGRDSGFAGTCAGTGAGTGVVRPLGPGDDVAVRALFRDTVCLGRPLAFEVPDWDAYESLCLDWYLGPGRADAGVLVEGERVQGYALVCTDAASHRRWQRDHAARFSARIARRLVGWWLHPDASRFLWFRLKDGWETWRHDFVAPLPAHAHINVAGSSRAAGAGRRLADHVDRRCRLAGLPGWFGEMNALAGRRARALERLGGKIVHRAPNHTLSWLLGRPVERFTVARWLPEAVDPAVPPTLVPVGAAEKGSANDFDPAA